MSSKAIGETLTVDTFDTKFREAFEKFPNSNWNIAKQDATNSTRLEGNVPGSSYLSLSLDPFAPGAETWLESTSLFSMPLDIAVGLHTSQRTLGQEMSMEIVSDEPVPAAPVSGVNYNRNGYAAGAVTGTPGTAPTNWSIGSIAGLTSTITDLGVGVIDGVNVKLTRFDITGTAGASTNFVIAPETTTAIAASTGQTWTTSSYVYGTSTHNPNYTIRESDSAGTLLGVTQGPAFVLPSAPSRTTLTAAIANATTTRVQGRLDFVVANGDAVNISVVYALPQMELGNESSAPTATVGNAITTPTSDLVIAAITQATTTLTVTTAQPHNLHAGDRIGTYGVSDSRFNYPSMVVATTPTALTFTVTAIPGGALPSVSAGPVASGFVYMRSAMGGAPNGSSMLLENASTTQASFYVKSEGGQPMPIGGTLAGSHVVTVGSSASIQSVNAPLNYAFRPSTEYRLALMADRTQWTDVAPDSQSQSTARATVTQVIPNPDVSYKLRFRLVNNKGLSAPVAHIQSVSKTGTTTATVITQTPHGLTVGDQIATYGVRDFTNFANLTAATAVASVIDANTFTVVWGSAVTAASQSGVVYRVNGGNLPSALGAIAQVVQSVTRTSNVLTLVGSAAWAGLSVGDTVQIAALHDTTGADLLLDGVYNVRELATTNLFLDPVVDSVTGISYAPQGNDIVTTNCGGAVVRRTVLRISFGRLFDFERVRVEALARPNGDGAGAFPVVVQNTAPVTISSGTVTTVSTLTLGTVQPVVPATPYFLNSAASTNINLIIAGTSGVTNVYATNIGATPAFVKLYNKATAPVLASDIPEMILPIPAAAGGIPGVSPQIETGFTGYRFPLGLGIAITGAMADNDTTAVAAGQVKVKLSRTI